MAHTTGRAGLARGGEAPEDGVAKPFSAPFPSTRWTRSGYRPCVISATLAQRRASETPVSRTGIYRSWRVGSSEPSGLRPKNSTRPLPFLFASYIAASASRITSSGWS